METVNEIPTTKQYKNKEIHLLVHPSECEIRTDANLFSACAPGPSHAINDSQNYESSSMDLNLLDTQSHEGFFRKRMYNSSDPDRLINLDRMGLNRVKQEFMESGNGCQFIAVSPPRKNRKRRNQLHDFVNYSEMRVVRTSAKRPDIPREVLGEIYDKASSVESLQNNADARVEEVMKAAKSLFSKRTRTLYHWMHPHAPKQQIKAAVSASWESLGTQEKQFYISQVLGRFGFPQCNLMVNPQLGGIKELPPLLDLRDFNDISTDELQNAISSITTDGNIFMPETTFQNNFRQIHRKKRLGRPPGSKNKKNLIGETSRGPIINQDFQDDPELSEQLQQFAMNLNIP
ncbi:hypothetical protein HHI36_013806 [Cryptolaemus montrouzieri]|uniref:Uncharacterized protein n=1 Tax=Cryptolaemus montrouzieri TaxID=559131 RepID=A0ABD2NJB8_9CUCU